MKATYSVSCLDPQCNYFHVTLVLDHIDAEVLHLKMPVWIPGSYLVREFAKDLSHFEAKAKSGRRLPWSKIDKSTWALETKGNVRIEVSYRIYGGEIGVHGVYLDSRLAFFNGPCLFLYEASILKRPIDVTLHVPRGWSIKTALEDVSKHHYRAQDFDELYDSPVQVSPHHRAYTFTASGKRHDVVLYGETLASHREIVRDIKRIVETEIAIFGSAPYERYTFLVQFFPGLYGGLEHRASSANIFDGLLMGDKDKYREFLGLIAHEFFHTWNVKRIRPQALGPFDYSKESYTRELWIAEGVTSYYDDHVLYRAGFLTKDGYFEKILTKTIARYENLPSKKVMSLSDSSFDAWIKLYRPNSDHPNTTMSYYLKGSLVAMLLDLEIIRLTQGKKTLDDVMRALWRRYVNRPGSGFTRQEFEETVCAVCRSPGIGRFLRDHVNTEKEIDWRQFFKPFGMHLVAKSEKETEKRPPAAYAGFYVIERNGALIVEKVLIDTPAHRSALQPGDELIAFDGLRVRKEKVFTDILAAQKPGTEHTVLFSRQGKVESASFHLVRNPEFHDEVKSLKRLSPSERRLQNRFLRKK